MSQFDFQSLPEGHAIPLGPYLVSKEELLEFASEFDPGYFHLDEDAAKGSLLGGLATSGWHNCAIAMRMMCDAYILDSTSLGSPGIEFCNWKNPVRAGDTLSGRSILLSKRKSQSRPGVGILAFRHEIENQHGELVFELENTGFFRMAP